MKTLVLALTAALLAAPASSTENEYPPLEEYLMPPAAEIALARSAAPKNIADRATVKVLTRTGYNVAAQGDNGSRAS